MSRDGYWLEWSASWLVADVAVERPAGPVADKHMSNDKLNENVVEGRRGLLCTGSGVSFARARYNRYSVFKVAYQISTFLGTCLLLRSFASEE